MANQGYVLSDEDANNLAMLANNSSNMYSLKAFGSKKEELSLSFTRVCSIFSPPFAEILTVNMDSTGKFISLSIKGGNPSCLPEVVAEGALPSQRRKQPTTTVTVQQTLAAPIPDTQSYLQRLEQERIEKLKGSQQDNRSFLAKYWIYIVPVVIFMVIQSATQPEGGDGQ